MTTNHITNSDIAIDIALTYGTTEGNKHKQWVIDQMIRALTNCPIITKINTEDTKYETYGESEEYKNFVKEANNWDIGVPP